VHTIFPETIPGKKMGWVGGGVGGGWVGGGVWGGGGWGGVGVGGGFL